jgi:UDP-N-acetylglucosamine--N-acetylmuramyl-(pentapeptide) pyrophosphoryl-undecaprenol N-acetylglucosamine transferase
VAESPALRIAFALGDTAGHFFPALAVAEAFERRVPRVDAIFVGPQGGVAQHLCASHGRQFHSVVGSPLLRVGWAARAAAAARALSATLAMRRLMRDRRTEVAIGFGSYATGGVMLAARSLGIFTAIHEANVWPGLANRMLGRIVSRVYLGTSEASEHFPAEKTIVTGLPLRFAPAIGDVRSDDGVLRILVLPGSRGGRFLAAAVPQLVARLKPSCGAVAIRHQAGDATPAPIVEAYARVGASAVVSEFIDDMPAAYRWADFAIARAGAGTIAELAAYGVPALLVPLADAAEDHQADNAATFVRAGAGVAAAEEEWDVECVRSLAEPLTDRDTRRQMSRRARSLAVIDAAERIVEDCLTRLSQSTRRS